MNFYDREMATYNHFAKSSDPNIQSAAYVYKMGKLIHVIKCATSSLYVNFVIERRPNHRAKK